MHSLHWRTLFRASCTPSACSVPRNGAPRNDEPRSAAVAATVAARDTNRRSARRRDDPHLPAECLALARDWRSTWGCQCGRRRVHELAPVRLRRCCRSRLHAVLPPRPRNRRRGRSPGSAGRDRVRRGDPRLSTVSTARLNLCAAGPRVARLLRPRCAGRARRAARVPRIVRTGAPASAGRLCPRPRRALHAGDSRRPHTGRRFLSAAQLRRYRGSHGRRDRRDLPQPAPLPRRSNALRRPGRSVRLARTTTEEERCRST